VCDEPEVVVTAVAEPGEQCVVFALEFAAAGGGGLGAEHDGGAQQVLLLVDSGGIGSAVNGVDQLVQLS
jgi:hypothetical protein